MPFTLSPARSARASWVSSAVRRCCRSKSANEASMWPSVWVVGVARALSSGDWAHAQQTRTPRNLEPRQAPGCEAFEFAEHGPSLRSTVPEQHLRPIHLATYLPHLRTCFGSTA